MRKSAILVSAFALFIQSIHGAEATPAVQSSTLQNTKVPFTTFTGSVTRNKVRIRLQPSLDSKIFKELTKGDLILVVGETDEYYSIKPPQETKAYIFRTFVLDNVVEGKHVNIRLEPDLDSPIIGQLNSGDTVKGVISPINNKWMEITPPDTVKFYVAKEYVQNIGDANAMARIQQRRQEVTALVENASQESQKELQKAFLQIRLETVNANLNKVVRDYTDFPEDVTRAQELLGEINDAYMQKKLAYLEAKEQTSGEPIDPTTIQHPSPNPNPTPDSSSEPANEKMTAWLPLETDLFSEWTRANNGASMNEFYASEKEHAIVLRGVVEPYIRNVHNKPGDYLLISSHNHLPSAYLYSTKVDLSNREGKEVTIIAIPRPNHNFAHPAYFVLSVE